MQWLTKQRRELLLAQEQRGLAPDGCASAGMTEFGESMENKMNDIKARMEARVKAEPGNPDAWRELALGEEFVEANAQ